MRHQQVELAAALLDRMSVDLGITAKIADVLCAAEDLVDHRAARSVVRRSSSLVVRSCSSSDPTMIGAPAETGRNHATLKPPCQISRDAPTSVER